MDSKFGRIFHELVDLIVGNFDLIGRCDICDHGQFAFGSQIVCEPIQRIRGGVVVGSELVSEVLMRWHIAGGSISVRMMSL